MYNLFDLAKKIDALEQANVTLRSEEIACEIAELIALFNQLANAK